ncbi:MAG: AMP-binding protein, partial [Melioribacteraceae bacterium]|nr:AMP-binding protein [Melioribacteraceae bacterium]
MMDYSSIKGNTLWERWQFFAETKPNKEAIIHWVAGEEPYRWNYSNLFHTADKISAYIKRIGIKNGDVCAIIMRHNPFFYPLYLGISGAGALPAVLAYPNPRLHPEKFREGLLGMSQRSGLDWILTERDLEEVLKPFIDNESSTVEDIHFPLDWDLGIEISEDEKKELKLIRDSIKVDDPLLLQHSSGTTGLQKPVVLSHKAILDHVINYGKSIDLSEDDIIVNWLPLYHDMGLIGAYHIPLASGITSIQIDPFEWVLAPILLFEAASKEKATITWIPNFAYNMMTDKLRSNELEELSLDSFRMIINGSEPVRSESHKMFYNRFRKYGLKKNTVSSFYAMAETTLTVTQTEPGKTPAEISVARGELARGKVVLADKDIPERICVSSGKIIDGCSIKIVNEFREEVTNNGVGEIAVKSVS